MSNSAVVHAADRAAAFLRSVQLKDGGFESFSSPTISPFEPLTTYLTTFAPALILNAVIHTQAEDARLVREKLAEWLLAQKSPAWSFNYWAAMAPERATIPYPDDLDDTFCALIALRRHDETLVDESCLGHVVKLLIATESQVGGPYRTWLTSKNAPKAWQDIDLAVNSNIAYFLKIVAAPLPNLDQLMEQSIQSGRFRSPYYPSAYPLIYYLARTYDGPLAADLMSRILKRRRQGWWGTPLQTALSLSALANLGQTDQPVALQRLLDSQLPDGSWPAEAFCLDPSIQKQKHYSGSAALTTALVLEALSHYAQTALIQSAEVPAKSDSANKTLHTQIMRAARAEINGLAEPLRSQSLATLEEMGQDDKNLEIALLPHFFNNSLAKPLAKSQSSILKRLGLANLYGWTAYTIYDDFLDGEGKPKLLSVANLTQRYSLKHFHDALPGSDTFQKLVAQTFDIIDTANAWELENCRMETTEKTITIGRLPTYAKTLSLADRSLGHTLTPIATLAATGVQPDDPRALAVHRALRHYLVARQLNDDLHDWEQDLHAGIITYVVAAILRELSVTPGKYTFAQLLPKMRKHFWHHTLVSICKIITDNTALARQEAKTSDVLTQPNTITRLVNAVDASTEKAISEQSKAKKFLKAYSTPAKGPK